MTRNRYRLLTVVAVVVCAAYLALAAVVVYRDARDHAPPPRGPLPSFTPEGLHLQVDALPALADVRGPVLSAEPRDGYTVVTLGSNTNLVVAFVVGKHRPRAGETVTVRGAPSLGPGRRLTLDRAALVK